MASLFGKSKKLNPPANLSMAFGVVCVLLFSGPASAKDCGERPYNATAIPDGAKASRDEIRAARERIVGYSETMDTYIACMEGRLNKLASFMTKEQRERYVDDLNDLSAKRNDILVEINKQIRAYRAAQQGKDTQD